MHSKYRMHWAISPVRGLTILTWRHMNVEFLHLSTLPPEWLAVTLLVSFPIVVVKYLHKRSWRKEGLILEDSLRHHEAIHILSSYLWDGGPAELHIQKVKRERVPLTALPGLCVKTMASGMWDSCHMSSARLEEEKDNTKASLLLSLYIIRDLSPWHCNTLISSARTFSYTCPQVSLLKPVKFSVLAITVSLFSALILVIIYLCHFLQCWWWLELLSAVFFWHSRKRRFI